MRHEAVYNESKPQTSFITNFDQTRCGPYQYWLSYVLQGKFRVILIKVRKWKCTSTLIAQSLNI